MVPDMTPSPPPQRRNPQGWKHVITGSLGPELELKEPGAAEERKGWGEGVGRGREVQAPPPARRGQKQGR